MSELLLVDDDLDVVTVLHDILRSEGYEVRVARNGMDGLKALDEKFPDLVLLDIEMPLLDGLGMAFRMFVDDVGRERIPILLLSGTVGIGRIAARIGTPYHLAKPYSLEALVALIRKALQERISPTYRDILDDARGTDLQRSGRRPA
jgi:CheY-like chemotaxis protein